MVIPEQWIRVAGNARAIKDGSQKAWRCYLASGEMIELTSFAHRGESTLDNCAYRTVLDSPDSANGLTAWIDMYGTLTVDNEVAILDFKNPA